MYQLQVLGPELALPLLLRRSYGDTVPCAVSRLRALALTLWCMRRALPVSSIEGVTFYCQYNDAAGTPGQYECAFKTLGFGPIALSCATGACEYSAPPPPPLPPVVRT